MWRSRLMLSTFALVLLLAFGTGAASAYDSDEVELATDLSGDEVVDGDPDPEGAADAETVLNLETDEVCFDIEWEDTDAPNEAHIHAGEQGDTGDVALDLTQGFDPDQIADDEEVEGCFEADDHDTLQDIADHPEDYYIDLHNDNGDLRGQLAYD